MCMGMSALVCSLIWTYLHSSNKSLSMCLETQTPINPGGRERTVSVHRWAGLRQCPHYIFAPTCSTFTSALPAFSEASPWQPRVTHRELILDRLGGIVHAHAGTQTSVWRWFCNKTSPLTHTHTQKWAKSSPRADFSEVTIWYWSTAHGLWLTVEYARQWEV